MPIYIYICWIWNSEINIQIAYLHTIKKVTPNLKSWFYFFLVWLNDIQPYFFKQSFEFLNSSSVLDTHLTFSLAKKQANLSSFYASPLWNMVCCRSNADLDGIYFESRLLDWNFYRKRLWKFKLNIYLNLELCWILVHEKKATETTSR